MKVWVAVATYVEDWMEPLVVVDRNKELAEKALASLLAYHVKNDEYVEDNWSEWEAVERSWSSIEEAEHPEE